MLRSDVRRTKTRLKAIYRSRGMQPPGGQAFREEKHEAWVAKLPKEHRVSAECSAAEVKTWKSSGARPRSGCTRHRSGHRIVRSLATAPAIGPIRRSANRGDGGDTQRFRTKRQFWAHCGLARL